MNTDNKTLSDVQPGGRVRLGTPGARWAAIGEPDPHGTRYDCERAALVMGDLTDDELANAVFMHGNERQTMAELIGGATPAIAYLTAAKDRIRWLSRALAAAESLSAQHSPGGQGDAQTIAKLRAMMDHSFGGPGFVVYGTAQSIAEVERRLAPGIAARQPVGEPVVTAEMLAAADKYHDSDEYRSGNFSDSHTNAACYRAMAAAAPPAQAVDLNAMCALLQRRIEQWRSHLPADPGAPGTREIETKGEHDYNNDVRIYREGIAVMEEVLSKIDGQAVGNG